MRFAILNLVGNIKSTCDDKRKTSSNGLIADGQNGCFIIGNEHEEIDRLCLHVCALLLVSIHLNRNVAYASSLLSGPTFRCITLLQTVSIFAQNDSRLK